MRGLKLGLGYSSGGAGGAPAVPVNTVAPALSGDFFVGQTLTCSTGSWSGFPAPTFTYQWRNAGVDIGGATTNQYTLVAGDDGDSIDCVVTATNGSGSASQASNALIAIQSTLWLDASDASTITHSGGSVSQWNDKSGNGRNVSQATANNQPVMGTLSSGKPCLNFDGSNDYLSILSPFMYAAGACTIFAVVEGNPQASVCIIAEANTTTVTPVYYPLNTGGSTNGTDDISFFIRNNANTNLLHSESTAPMMLGAPALASSVDTGSGILAYSNGIPNAGGAAPYTRTGSLTLNNFTIGASRRTSISNVYSGKIAEILVFTRVLNADEINAVNSYFRTKYGILIYDTAVFKSAITLPDALGSDAGKGFTCTGVTYVPIYNSLWVGNDGRSIEGDTTYETSLVEITKSGEKLNEISLIPLYPNVKGVQGVAYDHVRDYLWFASTTEKRIRAVTRAGAATATTYSFVYFPNGLAYNPTNDSLFVLANTGGTLEEISCATGSVLRSWTVTGTDLDQLFYDAASDTLWISRGANNTTGVIFPFWPSTGTKGQEIPLSGADAIEGIFMEGSTLYVMNDAYFHGGNPALNLMLKYSFSKNLA